MKRIVGKHESYISCLLLACFLCLLAGGVQATEVTGLVLVNAQTDRDIGPLVDGAELDMDKIIWALNVRAETKGNVGSVRFGLDDDPSRIVENVPPFALAGDGNGNYNAWTPSTGRHTITATPYRQSGARGDPGKSLAVTFTVKGTAKRPRSAGPAPSSQLPDVASESEFLEAIGRIPAPVGGKAILEGELKQWHEVTLTLEGPASDERAKPNPYLHYRLNVTFTQDEHSFVVPGYYAGDGRGGESGNKWRAHFAPPRTGRWRYDVSFRAGYRVNIDLDPKAGKPSACDGASGTFTVGGSDKAAPDFRAPDRGLLRNRGTHYLMFSNGDIWLKGGPDIPENMFGYEGFDNTPNAGHRFAAHKADWKPGDPDWGGGKGRCLIGALNAIAELGGNCIYFLPMNIGGDGKDTFPTIGPYEKLRYDNSKLAQWEIAFSHAQAKGIFLHFQLAETESRNENYHDNGELGPQRNLFYRELIARFGHHNASEFDIGEENDYGTDKRVEFAQFIRTLDPYDHPIATHTKGVDSYYEPLVERLAAGKPVVIDMTAFQTGASHKGLARQIQKYRDASAKYGKPWIVSVDEPQKIENDKADIEKGYAYGRRSKLWPTYMAGGGGFEWYVQMDGGGHAFDHRIDNFRDMDIALRWTAIARSFLTALPLLDMKPDHDLCTSAGGGDIYVLAKPGLYAIYTERCDSAMTLDLSADRGLFEIRWLNPRKGGDLKPGTIKSVRGGGKRNIGLPPEMNKVEIDNDWACLVRRLP